MAVPGSVSSLECSSQGERKFFQNVVKDRSVDHLWDAYCL